MKRIIRRLHVRILCLMRLHITVIINAQELAQLWVFHFVTLLIFERREIDIQSGSTLFLRELSNLSDVVSIATLHG